MESLEAISTLAVVGVIGIVAYKIFSWNPIGDLGKWLGNTGLFPGGILAGGLFPGGILAGGIFGKNDDPMATLGTSEDIRLTWDLPEIQPISPDILTKARTLISESSTPENIAVKGIASIITIMGQDTPPSISASITQPDLPKILPYSEFPLINRSIMPNLAYAGTSTGVYRA